jgi:pimeloyl-ACP methyl ester carboxylesterase
MNHSQSLGTAEPDATPLVTSWTTPTRFVETRGRQLAFRSIGSGPPIVLCNRFRGTLDTWDPAFLALLARDLRVITFDYSGVGRSTGDPPSTFGALAQDAKDLAEALRLGPFIIGGWSIGGIGAQAVVARWPEAVTHAVLIATNPAGQNAEPGEPQFYERALKPENDLEDEIVLFFEPRSAASRLAAERTHKRLALRNADRDRPVSSSVFNAILKSVGSDIRADREHVRDALMITRVPILILSGDHDISLPVENWYALSRKLPTAQHVVFPAAGHAPHHQYPEAAAASITTFIRTAQ